jgi:hypothetical protein
MSLYCLAIRSKTVKKLSAIIAVFAALMFAACDTPTDSEPINPLLGTWMYEDEQHIYTLRFGETDFYWCYEYKGAEPSVKEGVYTYSDTIIFFETTQPPSEAEYSSAVYKMYGNTLYCEGGVVFWSPKEGFAKQ